MNLAKGLPAAVTVAVLALIGCGGDDKTENRGGGPPQSPTDKIVNCLRNPPTGTNQIEGVSTQVESGQDELGNESHVIATAEEGKADVFVYDSQSTAASYEERVGAQFGGPENLEQIGQSIVLEPRGNPENEEIVRLAEDCAGR